MWTALLLTAAHAANRGSWQIMYLIDTQSLILNYLRDTSLCWQIAQMSCVRQGYRNDSCVDSLKRISTTNMGFKKRAITLRLLLQNRPNYG